MGFVGKFFSSLFGGGEETKVVQAAPAPVAQAAAPAADSAQQQTGESVNSELTKKRRGKKGLLVSQIDNHINGGGGSTGLHI